MSAKVVVQSATERMVDAQVRGFRLIALALETEGSEVHDAVSALSGRDAKDALRAIVLLASHFASQLPDELTRINGVYGASRGGFSSGDAT
jgi:hypothetical protein